jgi:hypothetical protein
VDFATDRDVIDGSMNYINSVNDTNETNNQGAAPIDAAPPRLICTQLAS